MGILKKISNKGLIGLGFALWLALTVGVYLFERGIAEANIVSIPKALWWSTVTLFTVGYGEYYPVNPSSQILAVLIMILGLAALGVGSAKASSFFIQEALNKEKKIVDTNKLQNHFLILGWKDDMSNLLEHVLHFNPELTPKDILILADMNDKQRQEVIHNPSFKDVKVIQGAGYQNSVLSTVHPERARRIFILADRSMSSSGSIASAQEADARTIMIAHSLSKMAPNALVTAELIDSRLDEHLIMAGVSDIIYSREYSRLLLGNATGGSGITNIISELLDRSNNTYISTSAISNQFIEKTYSDIKSIYEKDFPNSSVIGILENAGNRIHLKDRAIREAQKTADVHSLVEQLQQAKHLKCNSPIFNPRGDYIIKPGSSLITIETKFHEPEKRAS